MTARKLPIHFHFADIQFHFPKRIQAKEMVLELITKEGREVFEINYIFCTDSYLLQLNESYLKHDTLTDIITFHYHEKDNPVHSDIYISIERVKENAGLFGVTFLHEFYRVLFHGALHLCGYKDKTKEDKKVMRSKEDFYLQLFNVSRGTKKQ